MVKFPFKGESSPKGGSVFLVGRDVPISSLLVVFIHHFWLFPSLESAWIILLLPSSLFLVQYIKRQLNQQQPDHLFHAYVTTFGMAFSPKLASPRSVTSPDTSPLIPLDLKDFSDFLSPITSKAPGRIILPCISGNVH